MTYFQWMFVTDIMNILSFFYFTGFILQIISDHVSIMNRYDNVFVKILRAFLWPVVVVGERFR